MPGQGSSHYTFFTKPTLVFYYSRTPYRQKSSKPNWKALAGTMVGSIFRAHNGWKSKTKI